MIKANVGITGSRINITGTTANINTKYISITGKTAVIDNNFTTIKAESQEYYSNIKTGVTSITLHSEEYQSNDYSDIYITPFRNKISSVIGGDLGTQSYIDLKNENIDIFATGNIDVTGYTVDITGGTIAVTGDTIIDGNTLIKPGKVLCVDGANNFEKASGATGTLKEYVKLSNEGNIISGSNKDLLLGSSDTRVFTVYNRASLQCARQTGYGSSSNPDPNRQSYSPISFNINPYGGDVYIGSTSSSVIVKGSLTVNEGPIIFPIFDAVGNTYYEDKSFMIIPDVSGTDNNSAIRYSADKYPAGSIAFISPGHHNRDIAVWTGPGEKDYEYFTDDYMLYMLIFMGETYSYNSKTWTRPSFYVKIGGRIRCKNSTYHT